MKSNLRAALVILAAVQIAVAATGAATAATPRNAQDGTALVGATATTQPSDVRPSLSPSPSAAPFALSPSQTTSPVPTDTATADQVRPVTNLTAVVDPIAVPVQNGIRIRVGVRNSGPRSITPPTGYWFTAGLALFIPYPPWTNRVTTQGDCRYTPQDPRTWPSGPPPIPVSFFACYFNTPTMAVGETYWQSYVVPDRSGLNSGLWVEVAGFAEDPDRGDNKRAVVVHVAAPASGLPKTGTTPIGVAITGLALIVAGAAAIWYGRRRRLIGSADPIPTTEGEAAS